MEHQGSVSLWIDLAKAGDGIAAQQLWERYYRRLIGLARLRLGDAPRCVADEDDVVASAFQSFYLRAERGEFPELANRDGFWNLLATMTTRKAVNQIKHQQREKRGAGRVRNASALEHEASDAAAFLQVVDREPSPEIVAQFVESFEAMMAAQPDATHRRIIVGKLEGRSNREIAAQLDCSLSSVERKLRYIQNRVSNL